MGADLTICYRDLDIACDAEIAKVAEIHEKAPSAWNPNHKAEKEQIDKRIQQLKTADGCLGRFFKLALAKDGEVIGFHWIDLKESNGSKYGYIKSLWVRDDFQHKGIATVLKKNGEQWAKEQGAKYLLTTVHGSNQRMLDFNSRQGYRKTFIEMIKDL